MYIVLINIIAIIINNDNFYSDVYSALRKYMQSLKWYNYNLPNCFNSVTIFIYHKLYIYI